MRCFPLELLASDLRETHALRHHRRIALNAGRGFLAQTDLRKRVTWTFVAGD
jgi:hypothetical protein